MKKMILSRWLVVFLLLGQVALAYAAGYDFKAKASALPGISEVDTLSSNTYAEKYVMYMDQLLDPEHPEAGSFKQRIVVAHVGYDRPTVLVTEGYDANYAMRPNYREELSTLLDANLIVVEYRYFGESMPEPCNWDYLTVRNSLADLHHVATVFKQLYTGKWVATGISKGGQTTMFYRSHYPDDVDVSVPYVAPLNRSVEDGRHETFLREQVGTPEGRRQVEAAQLQLMKRKEALLPKFESYCQEKGYTFREPLANIYDFCILEYSFAFWQWGTSFDEIPAAEASDDDWFRHLLAISEPGYFSTQTPYTPFNVQAAKELGYYGYDATPFLEYMSIHTPANYLNRISLPEELSHFTFDDTLYKHTVQFLKANDPKMIYIYGGDDPWSASGVTWLEGKEQIHVFVHPGGSHSTRIATFKPETQQEIKGLLSKWLGVPCK